MDFIIDQSSINQFPVINSKEQFKHCGLLNSSYQQIAKENLEHPDLNTLYGKRQLIKNRTFFHATSVETILKVIIFLVILGFVI